MDDPLFSVSMISFAVSMSLLVAFFYVVDSDVVLIKDLRDLNVEDFTTYGEVVDVTQTDSLAFLRVKDSCEIEATVFLHKGVNFSMLLGRTIRAEGHVSEYEGENGYIFDEIEVVS